MTMQSHPAHSVTQMCHGENLTLHLSGQSSIDEVIRTTPDKTAALKPDLQPVPEQVTVDHHPYLDIIPFPSFRSRALSVMASSERALDEDALCFDLMHGACNLTVLQINLYMDVEMELPGMLAAGRSHHGFSRNGACLLGVRTSLSIRTVPGGGIVNNFGFLRLLIPWIRVCCGTK